MRTFEQLIGSVHSQDEDEREAAKEFWADCSAAFGDPGGQRLLRRLCELINPVGSPFRGTPEETHVCIGRQEIVAALWRRSQPMIVPSDAAPK